MLVLLFVLVLVSVDLGVGTLLESDPEFPFEADIAVGSPGFGLWSFCFPQAVTPAIVISASNNRFSVFMFSPRDDSRDWGRASRGPGSPAIRLSFERSKLNSFSA